MSLTKAQEKRQLCKALNGLQPLTMLHVKMAVILWDLNGIDCALSFISCFKKAEPVAQACREDSSIGVASGQCCFRQRKKCPSALERPLKKVDHLWHIWHSETRPPLHIGKE